LRPIASADAKKKLSGSHLDPRRVFGIELPQAREY
jgi:hypothetical protein